jgi:hypothetical protein
MIFHPLAYTAVVLDSIAPSGLGDVCGPPPGFAVANPGLFSVAPAALFSPAMEESQPEGHLTICRACDAPPTGPVSGPDVLARTRSFVYSSPGGAAENSAG